MTSALFKYIDTSNLPANEKPWSKVDAPISSSKRVDTKRSVHNLRGRESEFNTDISGFAVYREPATEKLFEDDAAVRGAYYAEVEQVLRKRLPGVKKVVIFDHTIRRRTAEAARVPVQNVHVDQTAGAAETRVRRHITDPAEAEELLRGRFQIVNVWRPIGHPASDHPLAVIDWRTTKPDDFVPVDLMYPRRTAEELARGDNDDRGKEARPDAAAMYSLDNYEVRGETLGIRQSDAHKLYYVKDMTPDEVILLKCYDSFGQGQPLGKHGIAVGTPHTAFADPETPADAPPRQSIEVRCLVFYE